MERSETLKALDLCSESKCNDNCDRCPYNLDDEGYVRKYQECLKLLCIDAHAIIKEELKENA